MTRERVAGFLFGISLGVIMGYYLRPPEAGRLQNPAPRPGVDEKTVGGAGPRRVEDRTRTSGGVTRIGNAS